MKQILVMMAAVVLVGCGEVKQTTNKPPKETQTKELSLEEKAIGTYQDPDDPRGYLVLCKEGRPPGAPKAVEFWRKGKKNEEEGEWSVKNGEIHVLIPDEGIGILLLNSDGNLQLIAVKKNGARQPKANGMIFKKRD